MQAQKEHLDCRREAEQHQFSARQPGPYAIAMSPTKIIPLSSGGVVIKAIAQPLNFLFAQIEVDEHYGDITTTDLFRGLRVKVVCP